MSFNYSFHLAEDKKEVEQMERFMRLQPFNYPFYNDWVSRTKEEVLAGWKNAILFFSDDFLVGDLIYQPHKTWNRIREMKNVRVHPKFQRIGGAYFMIKQAEMHKPEEFDAVIVDTHSDNIPITSLLKTMGYEEVARATLYDKNTEEVIFSKRFKTSSGGILIPFKKSIDKKFGFS